MGKVNQLFQDECERRMEQYLAEHPEADEEAAYDALFGNERDEPLPPAHSPSDEDKGQ